MKSIHVEKRSGEREPFSKNKLIRSLRSVGAKRKVIEQILLDLEPKLYDGISTKRLYRMAFQLLKRGHSPMAARYSLKTALMQLGPDGFCFERFVGALLEKEDYQVNYDVILEGRCTWHEIDIDGKRNHERVLVECKFHNNASKRVDIKTVLYVRARALDFLELEGAHRVSDFRLVTNTSFTPQAEEYATCAGLNILSWSHPKGSGIKDLVTRHQLHPITCLTSLSKTQKRKLLDLQIVLCRDLQAAIENKSDLPLTSREISRVQKELAMLLVQKFEDK